MARCYNAWDMKDARQSADPMALVVLATLFEAPRHPYEIQRLIRERRKDFAAGRTRALYHAVERLVVAEFIEPVETSREGRRPERTVYRITEAGREHLRDSLTDLLAVPRAEFPVFAVAVNFAGTLPPRAVAEALRRRSIAVDAEVAALESVVRGLEARLELPRLVMLEVEYVLALRRAEAAWVLSVVEDIRAGRLTWDPESGPPTVP